MLIGSQCWLGDETLSLPDMDTENDYVKSVWDQWAKDVVANYSGWLHLKSHRGATLTGVVDGFRIDAAKHVAKPFWTQFQPEAGIYTVGEALVGDPGYACQYMSDALSGVLNYPMFVPLLDPTMS